jgi:hypothetical protein
MTGIIFFIVIIGLVVLLSTRKSAFVNYIARYAPASQEKWWERMNWERFGYPMYSYWESFANPSPLGNDTTESPIMKYRPDTPSPVQLYNNQPYHLLEDSMEPPRTTESISCVNSRSCYATNFERLIDKTGNFRQMTNNYKRNYPDSCSGWQQELTLNFYKASPFEAPANHTGKSVSEA